MPDSQDINVKAFLKFIRYAEHKREDDLVYYQIYGNQFTFSDTSKHPNRTVTAWGKKSTAAGAYQILYGTWQEAVDLGIVRDFTPMSQDKIAIWKLKTRRALSYVQNGDIETAIPLLRKEWTSMPGAGQSKMPMAEARQLFDQYVAQYTKQ